MSEELDPTIAALLAFGEDNVDDGAKVLQTLDPELDFVKAGDLVGQKLIFLDFEERQGPFEDPFYSCRVITPEREVVRVAIGSEAIKRKLDMVSSRLPLSFKIVKAVSANNMTYFDLK